MTTGCVEAEPTPAPITFAPFSVFVTQIIKEVGSWTLTGGESGTWSETTWDLQQTVMAANRYGVDPFFVFVVGVDNKDSNMQLIQARQ